MNHLLGKTRMEVVDLLGPPDDTSVGSRKYRLPLIYVYDKYEVTFGTKWHDPCVSVMDRNTHETVAELK